MRVRLLLWLSFVALAAALGSTCANDVRYTPAEGSGFPAGCTAEPVFNLLTPVNGSHVGDTIHFSIEVSVFNLSAQHIGGTPVPCEGHMHVFAGDNLLAITADTQADYDISGLQFQSGEQFVFKVLVVQNNHAPYADIDPIEVTLTKE